MVLSGVNTYSGNTVVNGGSLTLADNAELRFVIGTSGANNALIGSATVNLNGDFRFDLTSAGTTVGDSWQIVDVDNLTETFGATFSVADFTDAGGSKWIKDIDGTKSYEFAETTGVLTVIPEPATVGLLLLSGAVSVMIRRRLTMN